MAADLSAQAQTQIETRNPSPDLEEILREHRKWVVSGKKAGTRANLSGANLTHTDLSHATLTDADLSDANLTDADLRGANLFLADLTHANLSDAKLIAARLQQANLTHARLFKADLSDADMLLANLTGATLQQANLTRARLHQANLTGAYLGDANLTNATLFLADLTHADLSRANLTNAFVESANFDRAIFEPASLPLVRVIARARNLELLTYYDNPSAMVQLRKQFEEGGFREQERKITYALKRQEAELARAKGTSRKLPDEKGTRAILSSSDSILANFASFILNKVFFDWTCQYGMSPGRPLMLGVVLWFLCSLLYFVCIHTPGEGGLYCVYGQNIRDDPSAQCRVERISPLSTTHSSGPRRFFQFFRRECLLLRTSMFFSLMSAFNIGFRDINFGRWLRLLTRQEFDIKAVGWARVIAGWQSLISVYLIALWVLTYFGRPFN